MKIYIVTVAFEVAPREMKSHEFSVTAANVEHAKKVAKDTCSKYNKVKVLNVEKPSNH